MLLVCLLFTLDCASIDCYCYFELCLLIIEICVDCNLSFADWVCLLIVWFAVLFSCCFVFEFRMFYFGVYFG